jgi:xanthine/CO dehydrogenase XdhC/CoxF family maturation factor
MNQVSDILALAQQAQSQNVDAVLATVVRTEGSAYRRPGAMMLICADGRSVGMVSGGCLERHLIQRAFWLTRNGACVQVYQTGSAEDRKASQQNNADPLQALFLDAPIASDISVDDSNIETSVDSNKSINKTGLEDYAELEDEFDTDNMNFGLGCHGSVHVLFERLSAALPLLDTITQVRQSQQGLGVATLLKATPLESRNSNSSVKSDLACGTRFIIPAAEATPNINTYNGSVLSDLAAPIAEQLQAAVTTLSQQSGAKGRWQHVYSEDEHYCYEWLVQYLLPPIHLLICGAGNDAMALVQLAKMLDWRVSVIDSRAHYATRARFMTADLVQVVPLEDTQTLNELSQNAAVAVISHSLTQDRARLKVLLTQPNLAWRYLGQLGPSYRTERLLTEIAQTLDTPKILQAGIKKLHYPIGYKLGGDGPEALALGIIAQISAVMYQQTPLKDIAAKVNTLSETV